MRLEEGQAAAERTRTDGEQALREAVLQGERDALREVESRARDRISAARRSTEAWIQAGETASEEAVSRAVDLICGIG